MKSYFVQNNTVAVHILERGVPDPLHPSLVIAGGLWEPAERAIPLLHAFSGHSLAFSFRGRGLSSTPKTGYDLEDHLSDIGAAIRQAHIRNYCLLGFSRGASYALGWALRQNPGLRGLILVDQPPLHLKPGPDYVSYWSSLSYLGVPILNFMRLETLVGITRESQHIDFTPALSSLSIPVAIFVGKDPDSAIPSNLSQEHIQNYSHFLPTSTIVGFSHSGHMIPDDEPEKYAAEVISFINTITMNAK